MGTKLHTWPCGAPAARAMQRGIAALTRDERERFFTLAVRMIARHRQKQKGTAGETT